MARYHERLAVLRALSGGRTMTLWQLVRAAREYYVTPEKVRAALDELLEEGAVCIVHYNATFGLFGRTYGLNPDGFARAQPHHAWLADIAWGPSFSHLPFEDRWRCRWWSLGLTERSRRAARYFREACANGAKTHHATALTLERLTAEDQ